MKMGEPISFRQLTARLAHVAHDNDCGEEAPNVSRESDGASGHLSAPYNRDKTTTA